MPPAADPLGLFTGRRYRLKPVADDAGGGGAIHTVIDDRTVVAKLFHAPCDVDDEPGRRLKAVRARALADPRLAQVRDLLVSADDPSRLLGFVMGRVVGHTIFTLTNPDERAAEGLRISPLDRIKLGEETARAFEALHARVVRMADAHPRNFMGTLTRGGRVKGVVALEPDTWLLEHRTGAKQEAFRSLAMPAFLPPELQAADLTRTPQTFESDRFALTLLVSLALWDCVPQAFAGCALTFEQRIAAGYEWVTPRLPANATPPDRLPIDPAAVPDAVMDLLRRGLSKVPGDRPTAAEFATVLADWHREVAEGTAASRFLAALSALTRARTLGELRRRFLDAFFAAWRRYLPSPPPGHGRAWAVRLAVLAAVAVTAWFLGRPSSAPPTPSPDGLSAVSPATAGWRTLIEPTDPPEE